MDSPKTKRGKVAAACPPDDCLVEIFSRLHAKPLFRFKSVSKRWSGLITDRLRCRKFPQALEGFFIGDDMNNNYGDFVDLSGRPVPLVDPSFSFLTKLPEIGSIFLLGSCNGLVLFLRGHSVFFDGSDESPGYIVCNPATEEWVSVPSSGCRYTEQNRVHAAHAHLIFDPAISPHFQLIQLALGGLVDLEEVHTFSSVTGEWRQLDLEGVPGRISLSSFPVCPFNGMLHMRAHQLHLPSGNKTSMVLAVGDGGRPFRTMHWPEDRGFINFVGQSQGQLHCLSINVAVYPVTMAELSIWVLEDYDAERWVLRDNVCCFRLFGMSALSMEWDVVGIHPDLGLIFFAEYWDHKLLIYDMDKKEVRAHCSLHGNRRRSIIPYVPYFAESAALAQKH